MEMYMYHIRLTKEGNPKVYEYKVKEYDSELVKCEEDMQYFVSHMYSVQDIIPTSPFIYGLELDYVIAHWDRYHRAKGNMNLVFTR